MARNFTANVYYSGKRVLATIIPVLRQDGMYFEVNIPAIHRFYMKHSELGRYDAVPDVNYPEVPYNLVLALSDVIEKIQKKQ